MKITCDMAMDLIALYSDGLASKDSREAVREHLLHCPACAKAYAGYRFSYNAQHRPVENQTPAKEELNAKYKTLAKNLYKSHVLSTGTTLLVTAMSVGFGIMSLKKLNEAKRMRESNEAKKMFLKTYFE